MSQVLLGLEEIAIQLYDHNRITEQIPVLDLILKKLMFHLTSRMTHHLEVLNRQF